MATTVPAQYKDWSPTLLKRVIAVQLKQLRSDAKLNQQAAADQLQRTAQHISNLEKAGSLPSAAELKELLILYGHEDRVEDMSALLKGAKRAKSWWEPLKGSVPQWFNLFLALEGGAARIDTFAPYIVPGMLQTKEYSKAIFRADPDLTDEEIQDRVDVREGRRRILERGSAPSRYWAVIDESVLYRRRGTAEVMHDQLRALREFVERPRVEILIVPMDAGAHVAQHGTPWTHLHFNEQLALGPVIYIEYVQGSLYLEDPADVARHTLAMDRLRTKLDPGRTIELLDKALREGR